MPDQAGIRGDFIKRIFAVAVSVGFATSLAEMAWVREQRVPNIDEYQQLVILLTCLLATVLSWDGYFASIDNKPLKNPTRFYIDVIIVFVYMILLLIAFRAPLIFLPLLSIIFILYIVWDVMTVREFSGKYEVPERTTNRNATPTEIARVYIGGLFDSTPEKRDRS
jgi:hypothetical protein